jgi:hypothetical protein
LVDPPLKFIGYADVGRRSALRLAVGFGWLAKGVMENFHVAVQDPALGRVSGQWFEADLLAVDPLAGFVFMLESFAQKAARRLRGGAW